MKKRKLLWMLSCVLLVLAAAYIFLALRGPTLTGRYLAGNDVHLIILADGSPGVMHTGSGNDHWFQNVQTGDRIRVRHTGLIRESHPFQITVRGYRRIRAGSPADIPEATYNSLVNMGWVTGP